MIEFDFSRINEQAGRIFKAQNISHARIFGWELETEGEGHLTPDVADMVLTAGYTYFYGVNVDDPTNTNNQNYYFIRNAFTHYILKTEVSDNDWNNENTGMLKYRNPQQFKADVEFNMFLRLSPGQCFNLLWLYDTVGRCVHCHCGR